MKKSYDLCYILTELSRYGGEEDSRNEVSRTILQEGEEASSGLGDNESSEDRPIQVSSDCSHVYIHILLDMFI